MPPLSLSGWRNSLPPWLLSPRFRRYALAALVLLDHAQLSLHLFPHWHRVGRRIDRFRAALHVGIYLVRRSVELWVRERLLARGPPPEVQAGPSPTPLLPRLVIDAIRFGGICGSRGMFQATNLLYTLLGGVQWHTFIDLEKERAEKAAKEAQRERAERVERGERTPVLAVENGSGAKSGTGPGLILNKRDLKYTWSLKERFLDCIRQIEERKQLAEKYRVSRTNAARGTGTWRGEAYKLDSYEVRLKPSVSEGAGSDGSGLAPPPAEITLLYYHGGGYGVGGAQMWLENHVEWCRALGSSFRVVSVEYSLSPQAAFPQAVLECACAYAKTRQEIDQEWAEYQRQRAAGQNISLKERLSGASNGQPLRKPKVLIGGDSAGGNLTLSTAILVNQWNKSAASNRNSRLGSKLGRDSSTGSSSLPSYIAPPDGLMLVSPFVSARVDPQRGDSPGCDSFETNYGHDFIYRDFVHRFSRLYQWDPEHPELLAGRWETGGAWWYERARIHPFLSLLQCFDPEKEWKAGRILGLCDAEEETETSSGETVTAETNACPETEGQRQAVSVAEPVGELEQEPECETLITEKLPPPLPSPGSTVAETPRDSFPSARLSDISLLPPRSSISSDPRSSVASSADGGDIVPQTLRLTHVGRDSVGGDPAPLIPPREMSTMTVDSSLSATTATSASSSMDITSSFNTSAGVLRTKTKGPSQNPDAPPRIFLTYGSHEAFCNHNRELSEVLEYGTVDSEKRMPLGMGGEGVCRTFVGAGVPHNFALLKANDITCKSGGADLFPEPAARFKQEFYDWVKELRVWEPEPLTGGPGKTAVVAGESKESGATSFGQDRERSRY